MCNVVLTLTLAMKRPEFPCREKPRETTIKRVGIAAWFRKEHRHNTRVYVWSFTATPDFCARVYTRLKVKVAVRFSTARTL